MSYEPKYKDDGPPTREELLFQPCAFHHLAARGASPNVDGGPMKKRNRASLAPETFHRATTDKSLSWQFQKDYAGLDALLKEEE